MQQKGHNSLLCNDYKGTQLVCTALEELNTEDHMPDEIELSEEDLMYDPDSETELNFINLERESGLSDSDDLGSDEVFHSDVSHSEPYKSPSYEPYKNPGYEPYESPVYEAPSDDPSYSSIDEFSCSAVEIGVDFSINCNSSNRTCGAFLKNHTSHISPP